MFHTEWCPICIKAMPEWIDFKTAIENKYKYNDKISVKEFDCDDENNVRIVKKYNIKAYPTIILIYKGKVYEYRSRVTNEKLQEFVDNIIDN